MSTQRSTHKNNDHSGGGPGSSHQGGSHGHAHRDRDDNTPPAGTPTNSPTSKVAGGGGERDSHHSHDPRTKS